MNVNYEDRILSILLQNPGVFKKASQFLKKDALQGDALKYVYAQMLILLDASKKRTPPPIDVLKAAIIENRPEDGSNYTALVDRLVSTPLDPGEENLFEHYVDRVHTAYKELNFKETLLSIADAVKNRDMPRAEIILQRAASKYSPRNASIFRGDLFSDASAELLFSNLIKTDPSLYSPIQTGLREIDDSVGGLFKTEVGLIQAMPGGGKSTCLMNFGLAPMLGSGKKIVLATLEMSKRQYWWRLASRLTGIPYKTFKFGHLTEEQTKDVQEMFENMKDAGLRFEILHFPRGATAKDIENAILDLPYQADLLIVDYLNRMHADTKFGADQNWLSTGAAMEELCGVASSIYLGAGVGIWTGQQLKSGKEGQRNQTTSDAAFSAVPGHHAHCVLYITETKDGHFMGSAKWRDGKVPEFQIYPDFARFVINREKPASVSVQKAKALPAPERAVLSDGSVTDTLHKKDLGTETKESVPQIIPVDDADF